MMSSLSGAREARTAFGLDLGGYGTGGSALVRACRSPSNEVEVTVYRGHVFARPLSGDRPLGPIVEQEVELLAACLDSALLYVDVPIDLQGLPCPGGEVFAWQLVKRPVDRAFGALPPLADRIGSVVARFSNLLRVYRSGRPDPLDQNLYETYPAASLRLLGWPHKGYKEKGNRIRFRDGQWIGRGPKGGRLAEIANRLGVAAKLGAELDHDELDAVICALTGVLDDGCLLRDGDLENAISDRVGSHSEAAAPPGGYFLIRRWPEDLDVRLEAQTVSGRSEMLEAVSG